MTKQGSSIQPITGEWGVVRINLRSDKLTQKRLRVVAAWDDVSMTKALEAAVLVYVEQITDQQRHDALAQLAELEKLRKSSEPKTTEGAS